MVLYGVSMALPFVVLVPAVTSEGVCVCCLQFRTGSQVLGGLCPCPAVFSLLASSPLEHPPSLPSPGFLCFIQGYVLDFLCYWSPVCNHSALYLSFLYSLGSIVF